MLVENDTSNLSTNHHLSKDVSNIVTFLNNLLVFYEWEEETLLKTARESNFFRSVCLSIGGSASEVGKWGGVCLGGRGRSAYSG